MDAVQIINDIKAGQIKPIYFLMGEEPYYIDKLTEYIEQNILSEDEKGFNQTVMYGRDVSMEDVISAAKRYPMMADRQVVVVREAQELTRTIDKLEPYAENPTPSTVLVFAYKYKTLDKRKKLPKLIEKNGVLMETKKLYDNQVGDWLRKLVKTRGLEIEPKAEQMFVEFIGADLSRIAKEIEKLEIILPKGSVISPKIIEANIGFNKEYNNFELISAFTHRDAVKATRIANYFADNQKDNPLVRTTVQVFAFFTKVMTFHGLKDKSPKNAAAALKVSPYFVNDYITASKNFPMKRVSAILAGLRQIDVKSKGVGGSVSHADLLKEMVILVMA